MIIDSIGVTGGPRHVLIAPGHPCLQILHGVEPSAVGGGVILEIPAP